VFAPPNDVALEFQDLQQFRVPRGFRGRNGFIVLVWQLVQATLFRLSPQPLYAWRRAVLRLFGAKIGRNVLIRPTARIMYPWKLEINEYSWIGDYVDLYTLDTIKIGRHVVVSQRSYLCTGSHDHEEIAFSYKTAPIVIDDQVWVAADVFVAPGVTIGLGAVIGARSTVFDNIPPGVIALGSPAVPVRNRLPSRASPHP
jgi:putative colanic acid biosynthesis acetyltransferase WcaF